MWMSVRLTSDHHFRGYNYSMLADQRNRTEYRRTSFVPALQPQFVYSLPLKGWKTLFWGNFFVNNMTDRDSDMRILQDEPGGAEKFSTINSEIQSTGTSTTFYPGRTRRYKERNGMMRYDGIFFGLYYEWTSRVGTWSVGTWLWNNLNRYGKYTWQEYFIWYEPPILKSANLKLQFFVNTSFDSGGSATVPLGTTNGQNYIAFETSHTFLKNFPIQVTPKLQGGYVSNNDNQSRRAGISNLVGTLKFERNGFDLSFHSLYRPEPLLYDTGDYNKRDGRLPDPGKQNLLDTFASEQISKNFPGEPGNFINYQNTSEKFLKNIFIISFGYSIEL